MDLIYQGQSINLNPQPLSASIRDSTQHHVASNNNNMADSNASQLNQRMQLIQMSNDGSESSTSNEENVRSAYCFEGII